MPSAYSRTQPRMRSTSSAVTAASGSRPLSRCRRRVDRPGHGVHPGVAGEQERVHPGAFSSGRRITNASISSDVRPERRSTRSSAGAPRQRDDEASARRAVRTRVRCSRSAASITVGRHGHHSATAAVLDVQLRPIASRYASSRLRVVRSQENRSACGRRRRPVAAAPAGWHQVAEHLGPRLAGRARRRARRRPRRPPPWAARRPPRRRPASRRPATPARPDRRTRCSWARRSGRRPGSSRRRPRARPAARSAPWPAGSSSAASCSSQCGSARPDPLGAPTTTTCSGRPATGRERIAAAARSSRSGAFSGWIRPTNSSVGGVRAGARAAAGPAARSRA